MKKHLRSFANEDEMSTFKNTQLQTIPNVYYVKDNKKVFYTAVEAFTLTPSDRLSTGSLTYLFGDGMTWREFCQTENGVEFSVMSKAIYYVPDNDVFFMGGEILDGNTNVLPDDKIRPVEYKLYQVPS